MGSPNRLCSISLAAPFIFAVLLLNADLGSCGCFKRIFTFGDSITDAGNFAYTGRNNKNPGPPSVPPYGETYFHRPTGRAYDGRLIVDFYVRANVILFSSISFIACVMRYNISFIGLEKRIEPGRLVLGWVLLRRSKPPAIRACLHAQSLGLPLLPPSLPKENTGQFPAGANFALYGATALNPNFFKRYNFGVPFTWSLDDQLATFKKVLARIAPGDAATKSLLSESLIVFGEIGGNDYNFWFFAGHGGDTHTPEQYMPDVIARIGDGVQEVINLGAKTVLVPGNFPIGCVPAYLSGNKSNKSADYDQYHCLKRFNNFSQMHNQLLKQEVGKLKSLNADVKIIYADYYGAFMEFVKNPSRYGIDDPLVACCGGNGPYGTGHTCNQTARICPDPSRFASWDQVHMTEKAYSVIANGVLNGPYADTPLLDVC
ncbi:GDSL esterase/lipase At1g28600-like [Aegilops tauschii subsp. strangulata]|uniref:GDSL esterase/lipase n=1 Tax=Aegilops tauschii TaxID=37682 RepID=M8BZ86_AEGTA